MTHLMVLQMVFSNPYKIRYHCLPRYRCQKDKEITAEDSEHFQNSHENVGKQNTVKREKSRNEAVTPAQGELREFREHFRESQDPMANIRNLHMQQRQN